MTTLIGATEATEREKAVEYLRGIIVKKHPEFDNNDMHDAQEFLLILLHNLAVRLTVSFYRKFILNVFYLASEFFSLKIFFQKESAELISQSEDSSLRCPIIQTFQFSSVPERSCTKETCKFTSEGKEEDSYCLSLNVADTARSGFQSNCLDVDPVLNRTQRLKRTL